jgi:hypothetical protein
MTETTPRPDGHVNHGGPILDRHDYRDWVEWPASTPLPTGARIRREYVLGEGGQGRLYVHPDDVPTDPDAELVERVAQAIWANDFPDSGAEWAAHASSAIGNDYREEARVAIRLVRDHDKADR